MFRKLALATFALFAASALATSAIPKERELHSSTNKYPKAKDFDLCVVAGEVTYAAAGSAFYGGTDELYSCDDVDQENQLGSLVYQCFLNEGIAACTAWILLEYGSVYVAFGADEMGTILVANALGTTGWFPKTPSTINSIAVDTEEVPGNFDAVLSVGYKKSSYDPTA